MALWDKKVRLTEYPAEKSWVRVTFEDDSQVLRDDVDLSLKCLGCYKTSSERGHLSNVAEYIQYHGFCRPCFAEKIFEVPGVLNLRAKFVWKRPVDRTRDARTDSESYNGADARGNNFGIGDNVKLFRDTKKVKSDQGEGIVFQLHEYTADGFGEYAKFLARVFFRETGEESLLWAEKLEALTCNAIRFDTSEFEGSLTNTKCGFDPKKARNPKIKQAFEEDVARAIWMSHRLNYLYTDGDQEAVAELSLDINSELKKAQLPKERLHYWFKGEFNRRVQMGFRLRDQQIAFLVPYLAGERVATYKVIERKS